MAFESAIVRRSIEGDRTVVYGTYTNGGGDTGGDIDTGLAICEDLDLRPGGSSAIVTAATVNETLPCAGNAVTVVTADNEDGTWKAVGR